MSKLQHDVLVAAAQNALQAPLHHARVALAAAGWGGRGHPYVVIRRGTGSSSAELAEALP